MIALLIVAIILLVFNLWSNADMSEALDRLTAEVAETRDATQAAVTMISGLAAQIRDNIDDSDALNALADQLDASQVEIADAITAGTGGAPGTINSQTDG